MKLTECKSALTELGIRPTKSLGQNFLVDSNILDIIVRAARLSDEDVVLEIGPGLGALTAPLLKHARLVIAVEKDRCLHDFLQARFDSAKNFRLLHADALDVLIKNSSGASGVTDGAIELPDEAFKLVANLPYSVSSPLIERFVENRPRPLTMVVTLQREMAQRLAAKPGTKDFGALTLFTQLYYHVALEHIISPRCFYPPPDVESAIVTLERREPRVKLKDGAPFGALVRTAFSQRRKMLRKLLLQSDMLALDAVRLDAAFKKLDIAPTARGEALPLETFISLANELAR